MTKVLTSKPASWAVPRIYFCAAPGLDQQGSKFKNQGGMKHIVHSRNAAKKAARGVAAAFARATAGAGREPGLAH